MHSMNRLLLRLVGALALALAGLLLVPGTAQAQRIKDIARVDGDRLQHMKGIGLVTGLAGTGDSTRTDLTRQMHANLLENLGISIDPKELRSRNVAVVMVMATVSSLTERGSTIDVEVSSIGDAKSLAGGRLLETPLFGPGTANQQVYAVAQGPLEVQQGVETVAGGTAVLEEEISIPFQHEGSSFRIILDTPDFSTASRVARSINEYPFLRWQLGPEVRIATPANAGVVEVAIPERYREPGRVVELISRIMGEVEVPDVDRRARVVIDPKTDMVTVNGAVRVSPVVVILGDVQISIPGQNASPGLQHPLLIDVIDALRGKGFTPQQIPAVIRNIHEAGSLIGELEER